MSHHYKLNRGVKSVIDTSPPFSMYNSPISVHYIPKRASSADAAKRRQPAAKVMLKILITFHFVAMLAIMVYGFHLLTK
ncbi:hypothetical protein V3C99_016249 [Haemonchus contortus]